jgi:hypothetical protein
MKVTRIKTSITVVLGDGTLLTSNLCTDEMHEDILANLKNEDAVRQILTPVYMDKKIDIDNRKDMVENYSKSNYLTVEGASMYVKAISTLSLPMDLAVAIWNAEQADDLDLLSTYLNFWTLTCLNPNPTARVNLFWFLNRYGMTISRSGLFVAYRNVKLHSEGENVDAEMTKFITESFTRVRHQLKQNPAKYHIGKDVIGTLICTRSEKRVIESLGMLKDLYEGLSDKETAPVYTDGYTGKFRIRIGEPVTMDRSKCNENDNVTCSRGLHVAGKSWLNSNYFGNTGLRVLVNPSDVVAVPPIDSYGKMRCCAYYPVSVVGFDSDSKIIDEKLDDGFEDNFIDMITYVGNVKNEETVENKYIISIPEIPEINKQTFMSRLGDIKAILKLKHGEGSN